MSIRQLAVVAALVAGTFLVTRAVYSQDDAKKQGGGQPSEEEMWKMMEARAAPVEEHAKLAALVGTWDADIRTVEAGKETKAKGVAVSEMLLGGRVLFSKFKGDMGGRTFEGVELRGYDRDKKQHWSVWCDSMGTGNLRLTGERGKDGHVAMQSEEFEMMGMKFVGNSVTRHVDADHFDFEFVTTSPGMPESKMTIRYTRRK